MTPAETIALCDEVDRLDKAATDGPWMLIGLPKTEVLALDGTPESIVVVDTRFFQEQTNPNECEDAHLIAYYRTAAPQLAAAVRRLSEENERMRADVQALRTALDTQRLAAISDLLDELAEDKAAQFLRALMTIRVAERPAEELKTTALASLTQPESGE